MQSYNIQFLNNILSRPKTNFTVQGTENKVQGAGGPQKSVDEMFELVDRFKFETQFNILSFQI